MLYVCINASGTAVFQIKPLHLYMSHLIAFIISLMHENIQNLVPLYSARKSLGSNNKASPSTYDVTHFEMRNKPEKKV